MRNLQTSGKYVILGLCLTVSTEFAQQEDRLDLGRLQTGATVSFVRNGGGEWGIEISGGTIPRLMQSKPAKLEIFETEQDIRDLAAGYKTVKQSASGIDAYAEIAFGDKVVFQVDDRWYEKGDVVSLQRKVEVVGMAPGGFNSSICTHGRFFHSLVRNELHDSRCFVRRSNLQWRSLTRR